MDIDRQLSQIEIVFVSLSRLLARKAGTGDQVQKQEIVERALANFSDPLRRDQYFELYAPEVVLHGYGVVEPGIDSVKQYYYGFWGAIPDARVAAEDIIEAPDKVVVRFSVTGTHRGKFLGIDGTGKEIQMTGMTILRFRGQRCVERWSVTDSLALAIQLGAFPAPK